MKMIPKQGAIFKKEDDIVEKVAEDIKTQRANSLKKIETNLAQQRKLNHLTEAADPSKPTRELSIYGIDDNNDPRYDKFFRDLDRIRKTDIEKFYRIVSLS